jgi:hypothetical protein
MSGKFSQSIELPNYINCINIKSYSLEKNSESSNHQVPLSEEGRLYMSFGTCEGLPAIQKTKYVKQVFPDSLQNRGRKGQLHGFYIYLKLQ